MAALVVFVPYEWTMHIFFPGPIKLSVEANKLWSNNLSKDRSFDWYMYLVFDILTNPNRATLTKK